MPVDPNFAGMIDKLFAPLKHHRRTRSLPPPGALSSELLRVLGSQNPPVTIHVDEDLAKMFASAAVNIWHRALHSLIVSALASETSPVWAAVSGYYSSHYSVRGLAHLDGKFLMYRRRCLATLDHDGRRFSCTFVAKSSKDGEHKYYWAALKASPMFLSNPLFTANHAGPHDSDIAYRNFANYADHVPQPPSVKATCLQEARDKISRLSSFAAASVVLPSISRFPDTDTVQALAFRRAAFFRGVLDDCLKTGNSFWNLHRSPEWVKEIGVFYKEPESYGKSVLDAIL